MKIFQEGLYYVSMVNGKLLYNKDDSEIDFSDTVKDFNRFDPLVMDRMDDVVRLKMDIDIDSINGVGLKFVSVYDHNVWVNFFDLIKNDKNIFGLKANGKTEEKRLMLEKRIQKLEEEKKNLERQIKNQKKYDELRSGADEIASYIKIFQDAGFSREEAMSLILASLSIKK